MMPPSRSPSPIEGIVRSAFEFSRFTDAVITCGDQEWDDHRVVVCSQCDFFRETFDGDFKEAHNGKVSLENNDSKAVNVMLHWFYYQNLSKLELRDEDELPRCLIQLYIVADKYTVPKLKACVAQFWEKSPDYRWKNETFAQFVTALYAAQMPDGIFLDALLSTIKENAGSRGLLLAWPRFLIPALHHLHQLQSRQYAPARAAFTIQSELASGEGI